MSELSPIEALAVEMGKECTLLHNRIVELEKRATGNETATASLLIELQSEVNALRRRIEAIEARAAPVPGPRLVAGRDMADDDCAA